MKNENNYTARYCLKDILEALGLMSFGSEKKGQPRLSNPQQQRTSFETNGARYSFGKKTDLNFKTLSNAVANDLSAFVLRIDSRALIKRSLTYINVYLSQADQLHNNTVRIYKFLKARERRYSTLIGYSGAIGKMIKQDMRNEEKGLDKKSLYLRLHSVNDIQKLSDAQYNRLLDDIIANLECNPDFATRNERINTAGKIYQNRSARFDARTGRIK